MSGIPGMGQRWQTALKIRVIMIPLPENTAAGVASGVCCSRKGCFRVSGSHAGRSLHIPSHTGEEKIKIHGRALCFGLACGDYFFVEEGFLIQIVEKERPHTYFMIPDCRVIRHHGRETPDKRIYRIRQKILLQM